ncbi:DUF5682 family protein [Streptomyces pactum]|uniref:DUF5682 family protein n=1 Tax=Streptomyces pactum TaxID=68249 RepID=UPI0036F77B52
MTAAARRPARDEPPPGEGPVFLGVRHHGPGSARAVRTALEACRPSAVLVEGPPEGDALVALAAEEGMRPPVALLAHAVDDPGRAAFWPLAEFSPEWVAIRWALRHGVPVRFIDLPAAHSLALAARREETAPGAPGPGADGDAVSGRPGGDEASAPGGDGDGASGPGGDRDAADGGPGAGGDGQDGPAGGAGPGAGTGAGAVPEAGGARTEQGRPEPHRTGEPGPDVPRPHELRTDPIAALAEAAGYDDPERWWEDVVEHRGAGAAGARTPDHPHPPAPETDPSRTGVRAHDPPGPDDPAAALAPFAALAEAMAALRAEYGDGGHRDDAVREAHMRLRLREARREFGDRVAVVCGAWHVPALTGRTTVTADRRLLKGLPKVRTEISWVPWTHRRLSRSSGYGAGIASPGWYHHLFEAPDRPVERWLTKVAGLLRAEDFAVSPAHVIEAVRLAETLAALRGRPLAGLTETIDAVRAVMCDGSDVPLALIQDRLIIGDELGEVPDTAPAVPLRRDLTRVQRSLRLKPAAAERELDLDLRKETDAARSRLLHRLRLLGIDWGTPARSARTGTGTFRETWRLCWEPELSVRVAEAGMWGTTVHSAATAKATARAAGAATLGEVTALAEHCLLAGLADALPAVLRALADRAALDTDVAQLARALPALVRSVRYGDVRGTGTASLTEVAHGLAERVLVGLPPACTGLDAEGAEEMRRHLEAAHQAINLLAQASGTDVSPAAGEGGPASAAGGNGPSPAEGGAGPSVTSVTSVPAGTAGDGAAGAGATTGTAGQPSTAGGGDRTAPADAAAAGGPAVPGKPAVLGEAGMPGDPAVPGEPGIFSGGGLRARWAGMLRGLAGRDGVSGLVRGRAARLLLDDGLLTEEESARLMSLALSPGTRPAEAAVWIEGFLGGAAGGGVLLVHDERLLALVDAWLTGIPADAFTDVLPLLRRTFSGYEAGVRRTVGELVRRGPVCDGGPAGGPGSGSAAVPVPGFGAGTDPDRAGAVLPTVHLLLGLPGAGGPPGPVPQGPPTATRAGTGTDDADGCPGGAAAGDGGRGSGSGTAGNMAGDADRGTAGNMAGDADRGTAGGIAGEADRGWAGDIAGEADRGWAGDIAEKAGGAVAGDARGGGARGTARGAEGPCRGAPAQVRPGRR